jgi:hypothetical protein
MKNIFLVILLVFLNINLLSQNEPVRSTKFVFGLSGPELLHAGITYRIVNFSQIGLSAGIGPSEGKAWTTLNLEHRLYIGKNAEKTDQKTWFFRQGTTYFPSATNPAQHFSLNLTVGKDIAFKNIRNGITIDVGVFYLADSENSSLVLIRQLNLWPAARFEFYFSL